MLALVSVKDVNVACLVCCCCGGCLLWFGVAGFELGFLADFFVRVMMLG